MGGSVWRYLWLQCCVFHQIPDSITGFLPSRLKERLMLSLAGAPLLRPPCFCSPQIRKDIYCPLSHHALAVCLCSLFLLEPSGIDTCPLLQLPLCTLQSCTCTPVTVHVTAVTRVTSGRLLTERTGRGTSSFPGYRKQTI